MSKRFMDRTAIVTGGTSGIGKATSIRLARDGAHVAIIARNREAGDAIVREIVAEGNSASFHQADVSVLAEIDAVLQDVIRQCGPIHMAFNNAGQPGGVSIFNDLTPDDFEAVLRTNLFGTFYCMKAQINNFLDNGIRGAIVNCASVSGLVGVPYQSAYCASKHAVVGLTKSVALEYASQGIRVNAVCPGGVATPTLKSYFSQLSREQAAALSPAAIGRVGSPAEIADFVAWLCSDEASFVIGQAYAIDGGYTAE